MKVSDDIIERNDQKQGKIVRLAKNAAVLAREIGCSLPLIRKMVKHREAPAERTDRRYDIEAWREFLTKHCNIEPPKEGEVQSELDKYKIECELKLEQKRKFKIANDIAEGNCIDVDEAAAVFAEMVGGFKEEMLTTAQRIAPDLAGLDVAELSTRLKDTIRSSLTRLSLAGWSKKKAFWQNVARTLSDPPKN